MPDLQLCSAHLHRNMLNRAGRNQQKHAEIHIHHINKAQASDHIPNINLQHLYLWKNKTKHLNPSKLWLKHPIFTQTRCSMFSPQTYVDLTWGLIIPTWRSAINLIHDSELPPKTVGKETYLNILTYFVVSDCTYVQLVTRWTPVTEHQVWKENPPESAVMLHSSLYRWRVPVNTMYWLNYHLLKYISIYMSNAQLQCATVILIDQVVVPFPKSFSIR